MIISKAPVRISLGGGGTDLPSYYQKRNGFLMAGTINKYVFVGANKQFYDQIILKYSKQEKVDSVDKIEHQLFKNTLRYMSIDSGIELTSLADVPAGTGLGSSGAFLISLLNSLHLYKGQPVSKRKLAEEACKLEIDIMEEHEGKQDKYACSFGGVKAYQFESDGSVSVQSLKNSDIIPEELEKRLYLFFTKKCRKGTASDVLKETDEKMKDEDEDMLVKLDEIKKIGHDSKKALEREDFDFYGTLLNKHWCIKKKYAPHATSEKINELYDLGLKRGALGGKIIGAGGGGFLMFYLPEEENENNLISAMESCGLKYLPFKFDKKGVRTIT